MKTSPVMRYTAAHTLEYGRPLVGII
jgi:hypothetical protein